MPHAYEIKQCKNCSKEYCHVCWLKCPECENESKPTTEINLQSRHEDGIPHKNKECYCFEDKKEKITNLKEFTESLREDIKKSNNPVRVSMENQAKRKSNCDNCGKNNSSSIYTSTHKFCSKECHLVFWKEKMPNTGGNWIFKKDIKKLEKLKGKEKDKFYNKKVMFILNNLDNSRLMREIKSLSNPNKDNYIE